MLTYTNARVCIYLEKKKDTFSFITRDNVLFIKGDNYIILSLLIFVTDYCHIYVGKPSLFTQYSKQIKKLLPVLRDIDEIVKIIFLIIIYADCWKIYNLLVRALETSRKTSIW